MPSPGIPVPPPTQSSSRSGRTVAIIVGVLVLVLLVPIGIFGVLLLGSSSSEIELSVQTCEIAADGRLSASGTVEDRAAGTSAELHVRYLDVDGGDLVDEERLTVDLPGGGAQRWSSSGNAGDEVQQIDCDVTAG